ncbi:MAG: methyltransferase domain-containing protein [bacterium]|nr:methyltransferase domain-containing protein [bacterium]
MDHEKMMQILHDVFDPSLPALAPGDSRSTRRALETLYGPELAGVDKGSRVLDIGCGNGRQTLRLAAELGCPVLAVDNHQPYLDELERRAVAQGLGELVETRCAEMNGLDLCGEAFDLVWAEGSAYVVGIGEALQAWRSFLKPGGALGFTELVWLEDGAPDECREFLAMEYPPMTDVAGNLAMIRDCGYELVGRFALPESSWWASYYDPLQVRLAGFEAPDDEEFRAMLDMIRREIDTYRRFSRYYGYVFFLLRTRS